LDNSAKNDIALTRIQKLIGKRMLESKRSKPCFYLELKADVTEMMGLRGKLKKKLGVKITTNAFYIRALALASRKYPLVVGRVGSEVPRDTKDCPGNNGGNIQIADCVNVGFAVMAPQGLVVPVIKDADKKSLAEVARLEKTLTEKARSNKLTLEEMEGETIALSNLGIYGIDSFFGIVPPPASTILAVGNVVPTVVCKNGKAMVREMLSLTVAADHRVVNGGYAAEFLGFIKEQLQNPQKLV